MKITVTELLLVATCGFVSLVLWGCVGDQQEEVVVIGHKWARKMNVENLASQWGKSWCDEKPSDAYEVSVSQYSRTEKVDRRTAQDGKNYTFREFLNYYGEPERRTAADGKNYTWEEYLEYYKNSTPEATAAWGQSKRCPANLKSDVKQVKKLWAAAGKDCLHCVEETFQDDWCVYKIDRWNVYRTLETSGTNAYPYWSRAFSAPCNKVGCEREKKVSETYTLDLKEITEDGKQSRTSCTTKQGGWSLDTWRSMEVGMSFHATRRAVIGLVCSSIQTPAKKTWETRIAKDGKPYDYAGFVEFYLGSEKEWASAKKRDEM